jgi:hypothetical protein
METLGVQRQQHESSVWERLTREGRLGVGGGATQRRCLEWLDYRIAG